VIVQTSARLHVPFARAAGLALGAMWTCFMVFESHSALTPHTHMHTPHTTQYAFETPC